MSEPGRGRSEQAGWILLPLRAFLALVFIYGGLSKIADRRFLDSSAPLSMHASVTAVRASSPIGGLLGPVQAHAFGFGVLMAAAELAVGLGVLLGLLTRVAAAGGMLLALSLWLTVSWGAQPWFTSADLVYLFAFTPLLVAGSGGVLAADAWLDRMREANPGPREDRTRRTLLAAAAALGGVALLGGSALFRRTHRRASVRAGDQPAQPAGQSAGQSATQSAGQSATQSAGPSAALTAAAAVPVGGARQVTDTSTGDPAWVLQVQAGHFTAYDAICPHQGCTVNFVSAGDGFACPCHGSRFDVQGHVLNGPAARDLTAIPVVVDAGQVRTA